VRSAHVELLDLDPQVRQHGAVLDEELGRGRAGRGHRDDLDLDHPARGPSPLGDGRLVMVQDHGHPFCVDAPLVVDPHDDDVWALGPRAERHIFIGDAELNLQDVVIDARASHAEGLHLDSQLSGRRQALRWKPDFRRFQPRGGRLAIRKPTALVQQRQPHAGVERPLVSYLHGVDGAVLDTSPLDRRGGFEYRLGGDLLGRQGKCRDRLDQPVPPAHVEPRLLPLGRVANDLAGLLDVDSLVVRQDQGQQADDVRRRHATAAPVVVLRAGKLVATVDRLFAVPVARVVLAAGGDHLARQAPAVDVRRFSEQVAGPRPHHAVVPALEAHRVIAAVVAGRATDDQRTPAVGVIAGRLEFAAHRHVPAGKVFRQAVVHTDQPRSVVDAIADGPSHDRSVAQTPGQADLDQHQRAVRRHARDAGPVVGLGGQDSGDMVAVFGLRPVERRVVVEEIPAVNIVHAAVAVVVLAVVRHLARVRPELSFQVRVLDIEGQIDHGDQHLRRALFQLPSLLHVEQEQAFLVRVCRIAPISRIVRRLPLGKHRLAAT